MEFPKLTNAEWSAIVSAVALLDNDLDDANRTTERKTLDRAFRKLQDAHDGSKRPSPQSKARAGEAASTPLNPRKRRS